MTFKEQLAVASDAEQLWKVLMPQMQKPEQDTFMLWAGRYPEPVIQRGINRAAGKSRKMATTGQPMTAEDAARYASSVMRNETLGIRNHSEAQ